MVFEEGAVCGGISKTGTNLNAAFGIPASVNGQPGHAAYLIYQNNFGDGLNVAGQEDYRPGGWGIGNNISGWAGSEKRERLLAGWGSNNSRVTDFKLFSASYMLLAQNNMNRFKDFVKARELVMLAELYMPTNISGSPWNSGPISNLVMANDNDMAGVKKAEQIFETALRVAPRDYEAWRGLVVSYLRGGKTEQEYTNLGARLLEALKGFPLPMADLFKMLENRIPAVRYDGMLKSALESVKDYGDAQKSLDLLQPRETANMAKALLKLEGDIVSFSFDGEKAGKIVLADKYKSNVPIYRYSLDGKNTWIPKEGYIKEMEHQLTEEEIKMITEDDDIAIHFEGEYGCDEACQIKRAAGDSNAKTPIAHMINIERHGILKVSVNDLENRVITKDKNVLEWREVNQEGVPAGNWHLLDKNMRFEGTRNIEVRKASSGNKLAGRGEILSFLEDVMNQKRKYVTLDRISIDLVSSEQSNIEPKENLIDGVADTIWHSAWNKGLDKGRFVILKLDKPVMLTAFEYLPRQDNAENGRVYKGEILTSMDGQKFEKIRDVKWARGLALKIEEFDQPIKAQYVKLVGTETGGGFISAAMINLYEDETIKIDEIQKEPEQGGESGNQGQEGGQQGENNGGSSQQGQENGSSSSSGGSSSINQNALNAEQENVNKGEISLENVKVDKNEEKSKVNVQSGGVAKVENKQEDNKNIEIKKSEARNQKKSVENSERGRSGVGGVKKEERTSIQDDLKKEKQAVEKEEMEKIKNKVAQAEKKQEVKKSDSWKEVVVVGGAVVVAAIGGSVAAMVGFRRKW